MSPRAAPAVGSAPTEHVDSPSRALPCGASWHTFTAPFSTSRAAVAKGPRGRAGVQSRAGESFTCSASCSGAPFLVWPHPSALPVARTRRTAGPWGDPCPPGPVCLSTRQGGRHLLGVLAAHCQARGLDALYGEPSAPKGTTSLPGTSS